MEARFSLGMDEPKTKHMCQEQLFPSGGRRRRRILEIYEKSFQIYIIMMEVRLGASGSVEKANMKRYSVSFWTRRGSINSVMGRGRRWGPPPCLGNYELVSTASSY